MAHKKQFVLKPLFKEPKIVVKMTPKKWKGRREAFKVAISLLRYKWMLVKSLSNGYN